MDFKDRIRELRESKKMSYTELGAMFGKTESAARAWELGRSKPDADTLISLAQYFDCTSDYLLGLSEFKNKEKHRKYLALHKELEKNIGAIDSVQQGYFVAMLNNFLEIYHQDYNVAINPHDDNNILVYLSNMIYHYAEMLGQAAKFASMARAGESEDNQIADMQYPFAKISTERLHAGNFLDKAFQYAILSAIDRIESDENTLNKFKLLFKEDGDDNAKT